MKKCALTCTNKKLVAIREKNLPRLCEYEHARTVILVNARKTSRSRSVSSLNSAAVAAASFLHQNCAALQVNFVVFLQRQNSTHGCCVPDFDATQLQVCVHAHHRGNLRAPIAHTQQFERVCVFLLCRCNPAGRGVQASGGNGSVTTRGQIRHTGQLGVKG